MKNKIVKFFVVCVLSFCGVAYADTTPEEGDACNDNGNFIITGTWRKVDDNGDLVCYATECVSSEYKIEDGKCVAVKQKPKERTDAEKAAALDEKQSAYNDAKENEQSVANRALTGVTTAAMGIGGMELAQGIYEKKADERADRDMTAYMETFRCSYADGKSVKGGVEEIELPGGNDEKIMSYRNEYLALASSLKERKESLDMKPGIESEVILDKANAGLYDDENVGITGGTYSSLYRAKMGNENDATMIASEQESSANRVKYGAIAAGAGAAVGIVGNSLINGKLNELIKEAKDNISNNRLNRDIAGKLRDGFKSAGMIDTEKLDFSKLDLTGLKDKIDNIDFTQLNGDFKGKSATDVVNTSNKTSFISSLGNIFGDQNIGWFE